MDLLKGLRITSMCYEFNEELLPDLLKAKTEEEISDALLYIGDAFFHISYHLNDTLCYKYLGLGRDEDS